MDFPDELLYHPGHLWVRDEGEGRVTVGITDFAQDQLGKVVYVDLPEVGDTVVEGEEMGAVESAKSVSDLIAPVTGEVLEINDDLNDDPAPINEDPYGAGWLALVKLEEELSPDLMDAQSYAKQAGAE